jgi:tRNA-dihydrouridine synthase
MTDFWHKLPKPFSVLAPMEDVTDTVFRQIISECGRPDVLFTEFTNCEGMQSVGQSRVIHRLKYDQSERPLVAQIWGITPEDYFKTAMLIRELGFDGIDINMGCPVKKVIKMGACSALIKNPNLAKEIILATKEGAGNLPVSVKTRIGFTKIQTEEWIGFLLSQTKPSVLTVHGRTVKEESKVPCHWDEIAKVVKLRDEIFRDYSENQTLIVGNGDVENIHDARQKAKQYGVDGVMIGRGIFKNPWAFNEDVDLDNQGQAYNITNSLPIPNSQRIELLKKHVLLWNEVWQDQKNFAILKKYFKIYISGFAGSNDLRAKLMLTQNTQEVLEIIKDINLTLIK